MPLPQARKYTVGFNGGLDTESPELQAKPGTVAAALNYEIGIRGGYTDIEGYRRFDGSPYAPMDYDTQEQPPGSGPILGLFTISDDIYAVRGNATGDRGIIYKATAAGWSDVGLDLPYAFSFENGRQIEFIPDGTILTGATSGATATVQRTVLQSGTFSGGDAVGYIVCTDISGRFVGDSEEMNIGTVAVMDRLELPAQANLSAGAKISTTQGFFGDTNRVYIVNGEDPALEFDGDQFVPIRSGFPEDRPEQAVVHEGRLWLSFGPTLIYSTLGEPHNFGGDAGEIRLNVGNHITALHIEPGQFGRGSLAIFGENIVHILQADATGNFSVANYRSEIGALPFTVQEMATTVFADAWGVRSLRTAQEFGNFSHSTITEPMQRTWRELVEGRTITASMICRRKNQYRVFFNDGNGVYCSFRGGRSMGSMPVRFPDVVNCALSTEAGDAGERMFIGTQLGDVMELDVGNSFNGAEIAACVVLNWDYMRSLSANKKMHDVRFACGMRGRSSFYVNYALGYGNSLMSYPTQAEQVAPLSIESPADELKAFQNPVSVPAAHIMTGEGDCIALAFGKKSAIDPPVTFSGCDYRYTQRQLQRAEPFGLDNLSGVPQALCASVTGGGAVVEPPDRMRAPTVQPFGPRKLLATMRRVTDDDSILGYIMQWQIDGAARWTISEPILDSDFDENGIYTREIPGRPGVRYAVQTKAFNSLQGLFSPSGFGTVDEEVGSVYVGSRSVAEFAPNLPESYSSGSITDDQFLAGWSLPLVDDTHSAAEEYDLQWRVGTTGAFTLIPGIRERSQLIDMLNAAENHYWQIKARNGAGETDWGPLQGPVLTLTDTVPHQLASFSGDPVDANNIRVRWQLAPTGGIADQVAVRYNERGDTDAFSEIVFTASDLMGIVPRLQPATFYDLRGIARNADGDSLPTASFIVQTLDGAPPVPPPSRIIRALPQVVIDFPAPVARVTPTASAPAISLDFAPLAVIIDLSAAPAAPAHNAAGDASLTAFTMDTGPVVVNIADAIPELPAVSIDMNPPVGREA